MKSIVRATDEKGNSFYLWKGKYVTEEDLIKLLENKDLSEPAQTVEKIAPHKKTRITLEKYVAIKEFQRNHRGKISVKDKKALSKHVGLSERSVERVLDGERDYMFKDYAVPAPLAQSPGDQIPTTPLFGSDLVRVTN